MTSIEPIDVGGKKIAPLEFLEMVLPDPASLGPLTKGKTCIGCVIDGIKDGQRLQKYIYNICDHEEAYRETNSQAISYTTGVPAMIGAKMVLDGHWGKTRCLQYGAARSRSLHGSAGSIRSAMGGRRWGSFLAATS